MLFAAALAASNTFAQTQHIFWEECTETTPSGSGTFSDGCRFPLENPVDGVNGRLYLHRSSSAPKKTHTWFDSNDLSDGWVLSYYNGDIHSWCPGAQIKRTCSTSATNWNGASVYSSGWLTFTYEPGHQSNDTVDMYCPSSKPFMLETSADTSAWW